MPFSKIGVPRATTLDRLSAQHLALMIMVVVVVTLRACFKEPFLCGAGINNQFVSRT